MTFTVALSGDSLLMRGSIIGTDARARQLQQLMRTADVTFTNLEVVASDLRTYQSSGAGTPTLVAPPLVLDELVALGIDVVSFANNHALNLGIEGMLDTIRGLRERRILCAGVGMDLSEASMPVYVDKPTGSVSVVACTTTFTAGDEATRPSQSMIGRPGLNPVRYASRAAVTKEQLAELVEIHHALGLTARIEHWREMGFIPPAGRDDYVLFGTTFFADGEPRIETNCNATDLDRIRLWISEAKARSDIAIFSVHSHEGSESITEIPAFLIELSHTAIDAGADVVVGHGPHRIRGVEIYRGKPIFYSLGNFISQAELMGRLSSHTYDVLSADPELPPYQVIGGSSGGFARNAEYWRSFVPILRYQDGTLFEIEIHPIEQGFGGPEIRRGRPSLAGREIAAVVVDELTRLSERFGTTVRTDGDRTWIELA